MHVQNGLKTKKNWYRTETKELKYNLCEWQKCYIYVHTYAHVYVSCIAIVIARLNVCMRGSHEL